MIQRVNGEVVTSVGLMTPDRLPAFLAGERVVVVCQVTLQHRRMVQDLAAFGTWVLAGTKT